MADQNPYKIGFDAKRAFVNQVGLGSYSRNLIKSLQLNKPNWSLTLFSPKKPLKKYESITCPPNTKTILPSSRFIFKNYWRNVTVGKLANSLELDLFHGLSHIIPSGLKIPNVTTFHDLIFMHHPEWYGSFNSKHYTKTFLKSALQTDHILSISEATKQDLIKFFNIPEEKITVTYQSCSPDFRKLNQTEILNGEHTLIKHGLEYKSFFMFVGTVEARKNVYRLTEAFSKLTSAQRKKYPLVFVGKKAREALRVSEFIKKFGLESNVRFLSFIEFDELVYLMNAAKAVVYPALIEGFGLPVLEAMSCGTPVLTSNRSSLVEVGGKCSYLVNPDSLDSIFEQLELIIQDENLYNEKIQAIPLHINKFSAQNVFLNIMSAYNKVLKN